MKTFQRFFKNYSLSIILAVLFLVSWLVQTIAGWKEFSALQIEQGQVPQIFGNSGYIWKWAAATFENWQSEFLQLFSFVILSAYFIHRDSPQSRDSEDEMMRRIKHIEKLLAEKQA